MLAPTVQRVALLVVGNEILSGKVADTNVHWLATELRALGADLRRVLVVPDEIDVIAAAVRELAAAHEFVITTGGVGPTHDDVTIEGVAAAFGRRVVRQPEIEAILRTFYGPRCTEGHLKMADAPEGAELVSSPEVRWPTMVVRNVYVLPGLPEIMKIKFAVVRDRFRGDPFHLRSVYVHLDEGHLKEHLDAIVAQFPAVQVGSYPKIGHPEYKVRVTLDARDPALVDRATAALVSRLRPEDVVRTEP
jgi:molybdenum cofactor synthesis domain-containing protein